MKTLCRQLILVFGLGLLAITLLALYSARIIALDKVLDQYTPGYRSKRPYPFDNQTAPRSQWDPAKKYLAYLPFEGISNQFYSLQNAATIAKRLNRTLVIPPITSNRHDRLDTNQPWRRYMDLQHMAIHAGVDYVEWDAIKFIDTASRQIVEAGSRRDVPQAWRDRAERFPCQIIRNYGRDYFAGEEDSIGGDFAYQFMLDLDPLSVPGYSLQSDNVSFVGDIVDHNLNSTEQVVCLSFTFTVQFVPGKNRWDIAWEEVGKYIRFLPRFASYVEDLIAFRFGLLEGHIHPHPPLELGTSILDKGDLAETFLSRKPRYKDYIAIHLRRGDIDVKCQNKAINDCIVPLSTYKEHVDRILNSQPKDSEPLEVVLVSDTESDEEKAEIDRLGWYRLDHAKDSNLIEAAKVLGPFSPAMIDSAVLTGRGARWVIGSRRSTMSWLAAMRLSSWNNFQIVYPMRTKEQVAKSNVTTAEDIISKQRGGAKETKKKPSGTQPQAIPRSRAEPAADGSDEDTIIIWDRHETELL
ncbi:hypothetical protein EDD11_008651 [Mortierella claussenii]|nr:hypothetical protein EDD11_008651 [Mortierella claussenii]